MLNRGKMLNILPTIAVKSSGLLGEHILAWVPSYGSIIVETRLLLLNPPGMKMAG